MAARTRRAKSAGARLLGAERGDGDEEAADAGGEDHGGAARVGGAHRARGRAAGFRGGERIINHRSGRSGRMLWTGVKGLRAAVEGSPSPTQEWLELGPHSESSVRVMKGRVGGFRSEASDSDGCEPTLLQVATSVRDPLCGLDRSLRSGTWRIF